MTPAGAGPPTDIEVSRERREVIIRWPDGHQGSYTFDLLRKECPCALCNDLRAKRITGAGMSLTVLSGPVTRPGEIRLTDLRPVGRYALGFAWSDGHDSGIYSFQFLRELCPCPSCRSHR